MSANHQAVKGGGAVMKSTKAKKTEITRRQAIALMRKLKSAPAILTDELVTEWDAAMRADHEGVTRRALLVVASKPGKFMVDVMDGERGGAEAFAEVSACGKVYIANLRQLVDTLESSVARIDIALSRREDMNEILASVG